MIFSDINLAMETTGILSLPGEILEKIVELLPPRDLNPVVWRKIEIQARRGNLTDVSEALDSRRLQDSRKLNIRNRPSEEFLWSLSCGQWQ